MNLIVKRLIAKNVDVSTSKEVEIKKFNDFYISCQEGSYLRMFLDSAGLKPQEVERAISNDFACV